MCETNLFKLFFNILSNIFFTQKKGEKLGLIKWTVRSKNIKKHRVINANSQCTVWSKEKCRAPGGQSFCTARKKAPEAGIYRKGDMRLMRKNQKSTPSVIIVLLFPHSWSLIRETAQKMSVWEKVFWLSFLTHTGKYWYPPGMLVAPPPGTNRN